MKNQFFLLLTLFFLFSCSSEDKTIWEPSPEKDVTEMERFSEFISQLNKLTSGDAQKYLDSNFDELQDKFKFPCVEGESVSFIYKGDVQNVDYSGDFNYWGNESQNLNFNRVNGTDLFYLKQTYELDARLEYEFILDGKKAILDPLNPNFGLTGWGKHSELKMPDYPDQPEVKYYENIPHGKVLLDLSHQGKVGINGQEQVVSRIYHVYLPPNYNSDISYPVIYFQDGKDYVKNMKINNVLDYMIFHQESEPVIAVFMDFYQVSDQIFYRNEDYVKSEKSIYLDYLVNDFVPFIDANYSTKPDAQDRTIVGLSNSGAFAVYAAQKHPEIFQNVISQSGALNVLYRSQNLGEDLGNRIAEVSFPVNIFLHVGSYEPWLQVNNDFYKALESNKSVLRHHYEITHQGHALFHWRDMFREALIWLNAD
ncbi:alpha/beta hydrolase-fold protein [Ancylomarina longa]|uniref:Esterase family protein n=1 Tax=Ancylomarina longa TaxID=2487017 RepID=A0A434AV27_9BACT|nr:alpha/beta hydrolase-fold protein [Ancylomarina longa]RUT78216.1 esterase family protein [Ancylomarina longa]